MLMKKGPVWIQNGCIILKFAKDFGNAAAKGISECFEQQTMSREISRNF